jgi:hypothetical protein
MIGTNRMASPMGLEYNARPTHIRGLESDVSISKKLVESNHATSFFAY